MTILTNPTDSEMLEMGKIAEELFGTEEDETQAKPSLENSKRLISIDTGNYVYIKEGEKIAGWSCVLPTSTLDRKRFMNGEINERQLFENSCDNPSFEALNLIAVIVLPEYRNKGLGSHMMEWQIKYFTEKCAMKDFYALVLTSEGARLMKKIERDLNIEIGVISRV